MIIIITKLSKKVEVDYLHMYTIYKLSIQDYSSLYFSISRRKSRKFAVLKDHARGCHSAGISVSPYWQPGSVSLSG